MASWSLKPHKRCQWRQQQWRAGPMPRPAASSLPRPCEGGEHSTSLLDLSWWFPLQRNQQPWLMRFILCQDFGIMVRAWVSMHLFRHHNRLPIFVSPKTYSSTWNWKRWCKIETCHVVLVCDVLWPPNTSYKWYLTWRGEALPDRVCGDSTDMPTTLSILARFFLDNKHVFYTPSNFLSSSFLSTKQSMRWSIMHFFPRMYSKPSIAK